MYMYIYKKTSVQPLILLTADRNIQWSILKLLLVCSVLDLWMKHEKSGESWEGGGVFPPQYSA